MSDDYRHCKIVRPCIPSLALLLLSFAFGAGSGDEKPSPPADGVWRTQPPVEDREVSMAPFGTYGGLVLPTGDASLSAMASEYTAAIVTVLTYRDGSLGIPDEEWPWLPIFTARVERSAGSLAREGDIITITQPSGGYRKGIAWDLAEDALLEVGGRYLLFLRSEADPAVVRAVQWGKWIIRDDDTLTRHWYSDTPIAYFAEVEGRKVDEVFAEIISGSRTN